MFFWLILTPQLAVKFRLQEHKENLWLLMDGEYEMVAWIERLQVSQLLTVWVGLGRAIVTCRVNVWETD